MRNREPLNPTVEFATCRQNGQIDGVIRSSIPASACLPHKIVNDQLPVRFHLLVSDPVATHLMRPEGPGRQPVGV